MSEFDKEKEREKLRKKLERDEEKRKETQRMSELLLRGATMTNQHCERCGDPIFRYDGQEFCPTCQTSRSDGDRADEGSQPAADVRTGEAAQPTDDMHTDGEPGLDTDGEPGRDLDEPDTGPAEHDTAAAGSPDRPDSATGSPDRDRSTRNARSPHDIDDEDLDAARASLTRSVVRFTRQAEATDDPRRARELLAAAREAAETLDALR